MIVFLDAFNHVCRLAASISSETKTVQKVSEPAVADVKNDPASVAEDYHVLVTGPWLDAKRALDRTNPEDEYHHSKIRLLRHIILVTHRLALLTKHDIIVHHT